MSKKISLAHIRYTFSIEDPFGEPEDIEETLLGIVQSYRIKPRKQAMSVRVIRRS